jgi:single-stranded-DNA-specific exonuclease
MKQHWKYTRPDPGLVDSFAASFSIDRLLAGLLVTRGLTSVEEARAYLEPPGTVPGEPFSMKGMGDASERILNAVSARETLGIFADSDIDGLTSLVLLVRLLKEVGYHLDPPPLRYPTGEEDYGLTQGAIDGLAAEGVKLLITLDSGIRDVEEIRYAKSKGMDVIVCDHHEQADELPDAIIVNPKQRDCAYPFKELAGVGVAFMLCQAVLERHGQRQAWDDGRLFPSDRAGILNSLLDLVALGTIADIVPMRGDNRALVKKGLEVLSCTGHAGLKMLKVSLWPPGRADAENNGTQKLTAKQVAWNIAPLLNTPGRYGKSRLTASFFLEKSETELRNVIEEIVQLNKDRRSDLSKLCDAYRAKVQGGKFLAGDSLIFVDEGEIPDGMCGLLASRLADAFGKAVITVSGKERNGLVKGSGRVAGSFNFFERVEPHGSLFARLGGHAQAFGFSAQPGRLPEIRDRIARSLVGYRESAEQRGLHIDAELPFESITADLVQTLARLEPYGHMNEEPLFMTRGLTISDFQRFGGGRVHGKFRFAGRSPVEAVGWNMGAAMQAAKTGPIDLVYRLEQNEYNGVRSLRMLIVDMDATG